MKDDSKKPQDEDFSSDDLFFDLMEESRKDALREKDCGRQGFNVLTQDVFAALGNKEGIDVSQRLRLLWVRIQKTNNKKVEMRRNMRRMYYLSAACVVFVLFLSFLYLNEVYKNRQQADSIAAFYERKTLHQKSQVENIELISGDDVLELEGKSVEIDYRSNSLEATDGIKSEIPETSEEYSQIRVPYGKRAFLSLYDGTKMWINAGTTVVYPNHFPEKLREVFVDGEVYLEVARDEKRPFVVKTNALDVEVLGTIFNVSSYRSDKKTSVVLVEGSVDVLSKGKSKTRLKPKQMYVLDDNKQATVETVNVENYISWHDGVYVFQNESIENVLRRLSRYYNVTMTLPNKPSNISCSGKLELKDDIKEIIAGIAEVASISYVIVDDEYSIRY